MTGTVEEASKAIGSFMDVMKAQPLSLALVVMNVFLLFVLWSVYSKADEARQTQMKMIFDSQAQMQVLLSKCVVPDKV